MRRAPLLFVGLSVLWLTSEYCGGFGDADRGDHAEVRARRFVLIDASGKERGEFSMTPGGKPALRIWDRKATVSATVEIDPRGMPRVALQQTDGKPLIEFGVLAKEHPVFLMHDGTGVRRVGFVVADQQEVAALLYDGSGERRLRVGLDDDGNPQLVLRDKNGRGRIHITHNEQGGAGLDLLDAKGRARAVVQVDSTGEGTMGVIGSDGKPTWTSGLTKK